MYYLSISIEIYILDQYLYVYPYLIITDKQHYNNYNIMILRVFRTSKLLPSMLTARSGGWERPDPPLMVQY